jgi:hypothetical protein
MASEWLARGGECDRLDVVHLRRADVDRLIGSRRETDRDAVVLRDER